MRDEDKPWLKEFKLINKDKIDIETGKMLHTTHAEVLQSIVQRIHKHIEGLQPLLIWKAAGFEYTISEAMQIHHNDAQHFVFSVALGNPPVVSLFDSMFPAPNRALRKQLLQLYRRPDETVLIIRWLPWQQQTGGKDCGLFCCAALCELAETAADPLAVSRLSFDQPSMRRHFVRILESQVVTVFPKAPTPQPRVQHEPTWFSLTDEGHKGPFPTREAAVAAVQDDLHGAFATTSSGRVSRPSSKKAASLFGQPAPKGQDTAREQKDLEWTCQPV